VAELKRCLGKDMNMKTRIALELVGPSLLGTALFFIWKQEDFARMGGITLRVFGGYLLFAYAFAILPSAAYAWIMEAWFRRCSPGMKGFIATVGISVLIGTAAGFAVHMASEAPVIGLGAVVGLCLGVVLGAMHEKAPNQSSQPTRSARG
jgi:hypothetical protein